MWPDELGEGIKTYIKLNTLKHVNEFMSMYVRRITPNATWNKRMTNEPNRPFFCYVAPSDIAYIFLDQEWEGYVGSNKETLRKS